MIPGIDSAIHEAICVTDDEPSVAAGLAAALGLPANASRFAWEPGSPAAGLDVTVGPESPTGAGDLSYAVVTVAGLEFELVWFRPG